MRTLTEMESVDGTLGTIPSYIEYSKMFYDGKKNGENRSSGHYNFLGGEIWEKRCKLTHTNIKLR